MTSRGQEQKRICIITAGHLATCPRMLKGADALHEAGYRVRVVSANYIVWAREADQHIRQTRSWSWNVVDYEKSRARFLYGRTALRSRLARFAAEKLGVRRTPFELAARAFSRACPELLREALREPADFFYGGTSAGIPVAFAAAKKLGVPYALDIEDLHTAEQQSTREGRFTEALADAILRQAVPKAAFVTVASAGIAPRIHERYEVASPAVILNVFPLRDRSASPPRVQEGGRLKLYWFSQTIGSDRGLQEAVQASALLPRDSVELHVQGIWSAGFERVLRAQWRAAGLDERYLVAHPPEPPDQLVRSAAQYDVGLALETPISENRVICMTDFSTNKVFTYLLAGLAVAASSPESGGEIFGGAGFSYQTGDANALASGLTRWLNPNVLQEARRRAWQLGESRYNWESEQGKLVSLVRDATTHS